MDRRKVMDIFDYPDRDTRRSQIKPLYNSWKWVFRSERTAPTHIDDGDTGSDAGSNSDTETANDTDSEDPYADSDSGSDDNGGGLDRQSRTDARLHTSTNPKPDTKYEIEDWLTTDSPLLCISGKPGTGKSTLMHHLANKDRTKEILQLQHPDVLILSHYFCNGGESDILSNAEGFLRNMIYQTLDSREEKEIQEVPIFDRDSSITWSESELETTLLKLLEDRKICLFADGINSSLLPLIHKLSKVSGWKICFSTSLDIARQELNPFYVEEHTYDELLQEIRDGLWRPLRDSGKSTEECTETILEIINYADGVHLLLQLAYYKLLCELGNKKHKLPDFVLPRSIPELCSQLLEKKHAPQVSRYLNLVQNYEQLMESSCVHFLNHYFYDIMSSDISLLEMTLIMRPELRDSWSEKLSKENIFSIELGIREVSHEIMLQCNGLLMLSDSHNEMVVITQAMELMDGSPKHHSLMKALHTKVQLSPGAGSFLRDYGKEIMQLDSTTDQQWWLDIVRTYLDLTEAGVIRKAHINRALAPLAHIKSTDLLERCHKLYRQGKLKCLEGMDSRSTIKLSPPFLALAAMGPGLQEYVIGHAESQATDILRHIIDHVYIEDESKDVLDFYYEPLAKLGDPTEKGIVAHDLTTSPNQRFVIYDSAIARILKYMVQYSHRANKDWIQQFSQNPLSLEQRTSISVIVCTLTDAKHRINTGDVHHWQGYSFHRAQTNGITDVVYALEVDLAFLLFVLQRRLDKECDLSFFAEIRAVQLRDSQTRKNYKVLHSDSTIVSQLVECVVQKEVVSEFTPETIRKITEDTSEEYCKASENLVSCFTEAEAGYRLVEEELFQKMCKQIE